MFAVCSIVVRFADTKLSKRVFRRLNVWREGVAAAFFRRSAIASLCELDDRALRDIGLKRSQIEAAVYGVVWLRRRGRL